MLGSLLALTRLEAGDESAQLADADVAGLLRDLVEQHAVTAERKGLHLVCDVPTELRVRTDADKVRRIAQNLITNALNYTTEGRVRIACERPESTPRWTLIVADTGPGMQDVTGSPVAHELEQDDAGDAPHPLEQDSSGAYAGEGIGLNIVKRLTELLHGSITLHSESGKGTTFTLDFPIDDAE